MKQIKNVAFILLFSLTTLCAWATAPTALMQVDSSIPKVFTLGQYDGSPFERMKKDYETTLATACKNDYETAYYLWIQLLKKMETHASKRNFDMNGIKLWLHVFWSKDGAVDYIAFHAKPTSRNFNNAEMTAFLNDFAKEYVSPLKHDKSYSNYSTASFPVMVEKASATGDVNMKSPTGNRNAGQKK